MSEKLFEGNAYKEAYISDDKVWLKLVQTDDKPRYYVAEGNCCSHSWIEHIAGLSALIGKCPVFEEVHVDLDVDGKGTWEGDENYIQKYGIKLKTMDGYIDIEFRNESNGYYSGWLEETSEPKNITWKQITEDF